MFRIFEIKNLRKLGENFKNLDFGEVFDNFLIVESDPNLTEIRMKSQRNPLKGVEPHQILSKLVERGSFNPQQATADPLIRAEKLKKAFTKCFQPSEDEFENLKDEFSAKSIEKVVSHCRELLSQMDLKGECWKKMSEFLDDELWEFSRLKEDLAEAEKKVRMVRKKFNEVSSLQGEENANRVMACAMLLAEKEMTRDHLQTRVRGIIEHFVARILAGTENEPGSLALELKLRSVFGAF